MNDDITALDYIKIAAGLFHADGVPYLEAQAQVRDAFRIFWQERADYVTALTFLADIESPSASTH